MRKKRKIMYCIPNACFGNSTPREESGLVVGESDSWRPVAELEPRAVPEGVEESDGEET
jgi:hypothetical protein